MKQRECQEITELRFLNYTQNFPRGCKDWSEIWRACEKTRLTNMSGRCYKQGQNYDPNRFKS